MKLIFGILGALVIVYATILCLFYVFQRSLMYPGATFSKIKTAQEAPAPFQNFDIQTQDGLALRGWYKPAVPGYPTIVYYHGNGDNLPATLHYHDLMTDKGVGVLLTTYRGYSGLRGSPSEQNNYSDAQAFIDALMQRGIAEKNIIIYGFSLGTGIATEMATRYPNAKALVLGAPYTTMPNVAAFHYKFLPVQWLLKDRYDTLSKTDKIAMPVFIINGMEDEIVPASHGEALAKAFKAHNTDVTFVQLHGRHVDFFFDHGGDKEIAKWVLSRFAQ